MGIQMTAVVERDNKHLVAAPYEPFTNNSNVVAYNASFTKMYEDKEFCELYNIKGSHTLVPEMQLTQARRKMLSTLIAISFSIEPIQHYVPLLVKDMATELQNFADTKAERLAIIIDINHEDFNSTIEFFNICAQQGYGISFT